MEVPLKVVVLINGYAGSGKDTGAYYMNDEYACFVYGFADSLKDMCARDHDLDRSKLDDQVYKVAPMLDRPVISDNELTKFIQDHVFCHFRTCECKAPTKDKKGLTRDEKGRLLLNGDTLYWTPRAIMIVKAYTERAIYINYWSDKLMSISSCDRIVIKDWRNPDELERVKKILPNHKLIQVRIDSPEESNTTDVSERAMDSYTGFDVRILNDKSKGKEHYYKLIEEKLVPLVFARIS